MNNFNRNYKNARLFYVFWSKSEGLYKIGCTTDVKERIRVFRSHKPAGVQDWINVLTISCGVGFAGPYETKVLAELEGYRDPRPYQSKSDNSLCKEMFKCKARDVMDAVEIHFQEKFQYKEPNKMEILISKNW